MTSCICMLLTLGQTIVSFALENIYLVHLKTFDNFHVPIYC